MDLAQALAGLDPVLIKTVGAIAQSVALISRALRSGGASTSAAGGGGGSGPGGLATNVFGDVQLGVREMLILVPRFWTSDVCFGLLWTVGRRCCFPGERHYHRNSSLRPPLSRWTSSRIASFSIA